MRKRQKTAERRMKVKGDEKNCTERERETDRQRESECTQQEIKRKRESKIEECRETDMLSA